MLKFESFYVCSSVFYAHLPLFLLCTIHVYLQSIHSKQLERVFQDKENVNTQIARIRDEVDQRREATIQLASETLKIRRQVVEMGEETTVSETRSSYALSLYQKISGISWDTKQQSSRVLAGSKLLAQLHIYYILPLSFCI